MAELAGWTFFIAIAGIGIWLGLILYCAPDDAADQRARRGVVRQKTLEREVEMVRDNRPQGTYVFYTKDKPV